LNIGTHYCHKNAAGRGTVQSYSSLMKSCAESLTLLPLLWYFGEADKLAVWCRRLFAELYWNSRSNVGNCKYRCHLERHVTRLWCNGKCLSTL